MRRGEGEDERLRVREQTLAKAPATERCEQSLGLRIPDRVGASEGCLVERLRSVLGRLCKLVPRPCDAAPLGHGPHVW